uniref:50S ribosomal protein L16, chloroplastic n=1 Tax=Chromera velia TaxID=505693 RepID=D9IXF0_9ALVE|nr:ribosomal protein L16 [Chromera velia]ADJ66558.1 ribosomal protein L16 [Chromera velia]
MILTPKRTKYKKYQRFKFVKTRVRQTLVSLSPWFVKTQAPVKTSMYLQLSQGHNCSPNQIESARRVINRKLKKISKVKIHVFAHWSKTKKGLNTRMGCGKGSVEGWVAPLKSGTVLLELPKVRIGVALKALRSAAFKLPTTTCIVFKPS